MLWFDFMIPTIIFNSRVRLTPTHSRVNVTKSATVQQLVMATAYVTQEGCLTAYRSTGVAAWDRVRCALMSQSLQHLKNIRFPLPVPCEGRRKEQERNWLIDWLLDACVCLCEFMCITCKKVTAEARRQQDPLQLELQAVLSCPA